MYNWYNDQATAGMFQVSIPGKGKSLLQISRWFPGPTSLPIQPVPKVLSFGGGGGGKEGKGRNAEYLPPRRSQHLTQEVNLIMVNLRINGTDGGGVIFAQITLIFINGLFYPHTYEFHPVDHFDLR